MTKLDPEHFSATLFHLRILLGDSSQFDARTTYVDAHRALFPNDVVRVEEPSTGETFERHVLGMLADHWNGKYREANGPPISRLDRDGNVISRGTKNPDRKVIHYRFD